MIKKISRKEQAILTKNNIYNIAIDLFNKNGYENVSIEDITNKAGIAKGTFYLYYKSKKDLALNTIALYDTISKNTYNKIKDLPSFKDQLYHYIILSNTEVKKIGKEILSILLYLNLADSNKFISTCDREIYISLKKIIDKGFSTGELDKEKGIDYYLDIIIIFIQGLDYYWCNMTKEVDFLDITKRETSAFINGILKI